LLGASFDLSLSIWVTEEEQDRLEAETYVQEGADAIEGAGEAHIE
jgi:hypothetical protein